MSRTPLSLRLTPLVDYHPEPLDSDDPLVPIEPTPAELRELSSHDAREQSQIVFGAFLRHVSGRWDQHSGKPNHVAQRTGSVDVRNTDALFQICDSVFTKFAPVVQRASEKIRETQFVAGVTARDIAALEQPCFDPTCETSMHVALDKLGLHNDVLFDTANELSELVWEFVSCVENTADRLARLSRRRTLFVAARARLEPISYPQTESDVMAMCRFEGVAAPITIPAIPENFACFCLNEERPKDDMYAQIVLPASESSTVVCGHWFHAECIRIHLANCLQASYAGTCPLCIREFTPADLRFIRHKPGPVKRNHEDAAESAEESDETKEPVPKKPHIDRASPATRTRGRGARVQGE